MKREEKVRITRASLSKTKTILRQKHCRIVNDCQRLKPYVCSLIIFRIFLTSGVTSELFLSQKNTAPSNFRGLFHHGHESDKRY
jgi:hypothetical protein